MCELAGSRNLGITLWPKSAFSLLLQEINGEAFKHLKILVELNLSHNNITHIERGTFRGNDRLQTLNLAGNQVGWCGVVRPTDNMWLHRILRPKNNYSI